MVDGYIVNKASFQLKKREKKKQNEEAGTRLEFYTRQERCARHEEPRGRG